MHLFESVMENLGQAVGQRSAGKGKVIRSAGVSCLFPLPGKRANQKGQFKSSHAPPVPGSRSKHPLASRSQKRHGETRMASSHRPAVGFGRRVWRKRVRGARGLVGSSRLRFTLHQAPQPRLVQARFLVPEFLDFEHFFPGDHLWQRKGSDLFRAINSMSFKEKRFQWQPPAPGCWLLAPGGEEGQESRARQRRRACCRRPPRPRCRRSCGRAPTRDLQARSPG